MLQDSVAGLAILLIERQLQYEVRLDVDVHAAA